MEFQKIDLDAWPRRDTFRHFLREVPCTYSMTVELDITRLRRETRARGIGLFPVLLYGLSRQVNRQDAFRMDFDEAGNVGIYDRSHPCYTVFHPETGGFTTVWTEYDPDFSAFYRNYQRDMEQYRHDVQGGKPGAPRNRFSVSCIPWTGFTGFHLNLQRGYAHLPPIFTIGKAGAAGKLPLAVQVHHGACDGFHAARFVNELQMWAESFSC